MAQKIKVSIADDVMFLSDRKCIICQSPGHHIHHVDGNNQNQNFDNLALLCFPHHDAATITGGLSRKLSSGEIKKYRALHYKKVAHERKLKSDPKTQTLKNVDFLYEICLDAMVSLEVGKLKNLLSSFDWELTGNTLMGFYSFPHNIGIRGREAILEALEEISSRTRDKMPSDIARLVTNLVTSIIPSKSKIELVRQNELTLYELGVATGFNIAYDGIKYLDSGKHAKAGVEVIYRIVRYSGFNEKVMSIALRDIDRLLEMSESYPLMKGFIVIYKNSIEQTEMSYPDLPKEYLGFF